MKNTYPNFPAGSDEYMRIPHVSCAHGECPCEKSRLCDIWMEYQIAIVSLHDSEELTHGNWLEITRQRAYIDYLEKLLDSHGIAHCKEYEMN